MMKEEKMFLGFMAFALMCWGAAVWFIVWIIIKLLQHFEVIA